MTCIVAIKHKDSVLVGGDSAACRQDEITIVSEPKVFKNGQFVIGYTGSFRIGQLLQYSFKPPRLNNNENIREFMINKFVSRLQVCLRENEAIKPTSVQTSCEFIVAVKNEIYTVGVDYSVTGVASEFAAVGSGALYALGSLYSTSHLKPSDRATVALKCASHFSPWVREPFTFISTKSR